MIECISNYKMRLILDKNALKLLLKTFLISLLSIYYNILCSFTSLKDNKLFNQSVSFNKLKYEYYFRIILSIITPSVSGFYVITNIYGNESEIVYQNSIVLGLYICNG